MVNPILEFKNVSYKYPGTENWVLRDINFKIPQNSFFVLAGPTGCGKTTLLMLARGFHKEYGGIFQGDIVIFGKNIKDKNISELWAKIGIIFQDPALQLHQLRVIDEVMSPLMYRNLSFKECEKRAKEIINEILGENFYQRSPQELSSGEQQKVALAACLVMECDILLLDEPFSFLDEKADKEIMKILLKLKKEGKTIIVATHALEQVARYTDKICLIDKGRIILEGPVQKVLYSSKTEQVLTAPLSIRTAQALLKNKKLNQKIIDWQDLVNKIKTQESNEIGLIKQGSEKKTMLKLDNLSYNYPDGNKGIKDINLFLHQGEILGIVGANGSGKTTLAKLILRLLKPQQGRIELFGKDITKLNTSERAKQIGYVTQNPIEMLFEIDVLKECAFGPKCLGIKNPERKAKETLSKLDLLKYKNKHPDSLSGGERSKLALADILVNQPKILVLDEPEFGLDPKSWQSIAQTLKQLKQEGKSLIVITQDLEISLFLCDRIAIMEDGEILKIGTPKEIYSNYKLLQKAKLPFLPIFKFLDWVANKDLFNEEKFIKIIVSKTKQVL